MTKTSLPVEQVLTLLGELPGRIAAATKGLTPAQLRTSPSPGEWPATEVLAHLRSCADVWDSCIATMLADDHPTIKAVNPKTWISQTNYPTLSFQASFRAYEAQRAELLALLEPLPPQAWSRTATVTGAGAPLTRTVQFYVQWMAGHERTHVKQFAHIADAVHW